MATVGRVSAPSVTPDALPGARVTARLDPDASAPLVQGIRDVGKVVQVIADREVEKAGMASVLEARRKLSDWERVQFDPANPEGVYGAKGREALGTVDRVAPEFDRVQAELVDSIRDPRAKQAFLNYATGQRESMLGRIQTHATREYEGYVAAEFKASVANSADAAARAAAEGRFDDQAREVQSGLQIIRAKGVMDGAPADAIEQQERAYTSAVHSTAIDTLLAQGTIGEAVAYFDANAEELSASDSAAVQARMKPQLIAQSAFAILDGMDAGVAPAAAGVGATLDQVWDAQVRQESGGRQHKADGSVVTSSKGAIGIAQIMPDTGPVAARYAGVPWDPERLKNDAAYNEVLGRAYMQAQLDTYGSAPLALAAYNAGPGAVNKWIASIGDPRRGEVSVSEFVARIPYKETREYVQKITARSGVAVGDGEGAAPAPRLAGSLEAQLASLRAVNNPDLREKLEQGIRSRHLIREQDRQDVERETKQSIYGIVEAMDPRGSLQTALTPSQYAFAAQNGLVSGLERRLAERVTGQAPVSSPDTMAALHRLFYNASQGSEAARKWVREADLFTMQLSPTDREWAIKMQAAVQKPEEAEKMPGFATDAQIFENTRWKLGIPKGKAGDQRWGAVQDQYLQASRAFVKANGREPSADEKQAIMDRMTTTFVRETWFGASSEEVPVVNARPEDVEALPADVRTQLLDLFKRAGNPNPTPMQVMLLYRQYQDSRNVQAGQ